MTRRERLAFARMVWRNGDAETRRGMVKRALLHPAAGIVVAGLCGLGVLIVGW